MMLRIVSDGLRPAPLTQFFVFAEIFLLKTPHVAADSGVRFCDGTQRMSE